VRAWFTRILNNQVLTDDRPSKRSMPRTTPSHVSCTASSATARVETNDIAKRTSWAW
jgi:hypothetical protein